LTLRDAAPPVTGLDLPGRVLPAILKPQGMRPLAIGYYTNWAGKDDASWPSLKRTLKTLDWVVPSWPGNGSPMPSRGRNSTAAACR